MSNNNREFKIEGMRDVKMFSSDFNAWITIGKAKTVQGVHEVTEDFIWRASQS